MHINFLVNEVDGGWEPTDKRLGGTEESVVRWAEELVKTGHVVAIWRNSTKNPVGVCNGVYYNARQMYEGVGGICINVKSSEIDPQESTLYLTNETDATDKDLSKYLGVIWPSQWAEEHIPVNNPRRFILPHGYDSSQIYPDKKIPKQCLYASSPDRGLDRLLRAWPSVVRACPDATLIVTYGAQDYDVPGVKFLDATEEEMDELYRTSDIWAYPCNGGELYCMTGIKAQAAGCVPVIVPTMALQETVKYAYTSTPKGYEASLIQALTEDKQRETIREYMAKHYYPNWADSTDQLLGIIKEVL